MGTNYYMTVNPCEHCGRGPHDLHIGKSSMGWCFSLNTHPDEGIETLDDWRARWAVDPIRNEYHEVVTAEEMEAIITRRGRTTQRTEPPLGYLSWEAFYAANHAEPGPNGLLRHRVDGRHCIAHGPGTYDIMCGEFS